MNNSSTERGQVLVLVILAMVALMGFSALAVDMGQVYAERRRAQNAADAAAFSAVMVAAQAELDDDEDAVEDDAIEAALNSAVQNGFEDDDADEETGETLDVFVSHPPVNGPYANNDDYYQVVITTSLAPTFSQFLGMNRQTISVESVAHVQLQDTVASGNALHSTDPNASPALLFDGGVNVKIKGGNIYSNSSAAGSVEHKGAGNVQVEDGGLMTPGTYIKRGGAGDLNVPPQNGAGSQNLRAVPEPDCSHLPVVTESRFGNGHIQPGRYVNGIEVQGNVVMDAGMYCVDDGISGNGGGSLRGSGVFIVLRSGVMRFNGNVNVQLVRPDAITDAPAHNEQYGGMLFYAYPGTEISMTGTGDIIYAGTVYAPQSTCDIGGNADTAGIYGDVICSYIKIHGDAKVSINYDPETSYRRTSEVERTE